MSSGQIREGALVLADGSVFEGELIGAEHAAASGEVVFNTALSGYQEIITDPSYAGQIITFTYPHIGNYGVNADDDESRGVFCRGVIIRELARRHSNYRAEQGLNEFLLANGLAGIAGIDTRRLTRLIRSQGAIPGAFGSLTESELLAQARQESGTDGAKVSDTRPCSMSRRMRSRSRLAGSPSPPPPGMRQRKWSPGLRLRWMPEYWATPL